MKKFKAVFSILLVFTLVFALFACSKTDTPAGGDASSPSSANTDGPATSPSTGSDAPNDDDWVSFTLAVDNYLGRFLAGINPAESWTGCDAVYDSTFKVNPATKEIFSDILTDWYFEDDEGTSLIMKMREDIYFSNGDNATSEDLIFTYFNHLERGSNYLNNFNLIQEECVEVDKYTARFKFEKAYPAFFNSSFYLVNKAWSQEVGWDSLEWYKPVASGPYYVHEWVADSYMSLRLRDDYWNKDVGEFYVDEWIIKFFPDASTLYMSLEVGDIDIAMNVSAADYGRFVKSGGEGFDCKLMQAGSTLNFIFGFADLPGVWEDIRIREAMSLAVKWDEVGQLAMGDMYMPAYSVASSVSPDYVNTGTFEYNPERAKELFAEMGYTPDNKLVLKTTMMDSQMYKNACEVFKFYADQIGCLDVTIEHQDTSAALGVWLSPGGNDFGFWYAVSGSPTGEVRQAIAEAADPSGVTWDYVPFPDFLEIYARMANSVDPKVRSDAGKEIQQYMYDNIIYIPVSEWTYSVGWRTDKFTEEQITAFNRSTNNFQISKFGLASSWS